MTQYGYHASHEQFRPGDLLRYVRMAEQSGFDAAMCSDHIAPWSLRQGQSGFAWSWLGAALEATAMSFGVVNSPVGRYNPAIIAQAAATLADMYPGRFWIAVGSGLFSNEHVTGDRWPPKDERNQRLREAALVMRRLWSGETVSHDGHFTLDQARLYTRPDTPPQLFAAALSPETAAFAGDWADGLITVHEQPEQLAAVLDAFRAAGGSDKPVILQMQISWAEDEDTALANAFDQWRGNIFPSSVLTDLRLPEDFDAAAELVTPQQLQERIHISADLNEHIRCLRDDADLGVTRVFVHNVGRNQEAFIRAFGERVLPALRNER